MKVLLKILPYLPTPWTLGSVVLFWVLGQEFLNPVANGILSLVALLPFLFGLSKGSLKEGIIQSFWLNGLFRYTFYFYVFDYYFGMLSYWEMGLFILLFGIFLSILENRFLEVALGFHFFKSWPLKIFGTALLFFTRETIVYHYLFHDALGYISEPNSFVGALSKFGGVPLVSTIIFLTSAAVLWLIKEPRIKRPKTLLLLLPIFFGLAYTEKDLMPSKKLEAVVVQTNEVLKLYYEGDKATNEASYWKEVMEQVKEAPSSGTLFLPELVSPYALVSASSLAGAKEAEEIQDLANTRSQEIFLGFYYVQGNDKVNAIAKFSPKKAVETIEKKELIPFLETSFLEGFTRRANPSKVFSTDGLDFASSICFESYRPNTLLATLKEHNPKVMVQFSDESDVKNSYLHYLDRIARYRARESNTPLLRVTKTGYSGTVDYKGQRLETIFPGVKKTMAVSLETIEKPTPTFYVRNHQTIILGSFLVYILFVLSLIIRGRIK